MPTDARVVVAPAKARGPLRVEDIRLPDPTGHQVVLICKKPFAEWVLGTMPPSRLDGPIVMEDEPVFTSREAAEWEVFRRRWRQHTGEDINLPFRD